MKIKKSRKKFSIFNSKLSIFKGFTLVEILIVIAVVGVLAVGVLVAINPLEQIARGRDAERKTTVSSLSNALESSVVFQSQYPEAQANWMNSLVDEGELKTVPPAVSGDSCEADVLDGIYEHNGYCYATNSDQTQAIVYALLESSSENSECLAGKAYFLWSSESGENGLYCSLTQPAGTSGIEFGESSSLDVGLVGWWKFDGNAKDFSGNDNDGEVYRATSVLDRNGQANSAYSFNGIDNYIDVPDSDTLNASKTQTTVAFWFKLNSVSTLNAMVGKGNRAPDNNLFWIYNYPSSPPYWSFNIGDGTPDPWDYFNGEHAPVEGVWYHFVGVWDSGTGKIYIDDEELPTTKGTTSTTTLSGAPGWNLIIGKRPYEDNLWLDGSMDDLRIYNRALSPDDVEALYELE